MASAKTILSDIGKFLKAAFSSSAIKIEAQIADIALPGFSTLINATANAIINAENASIAAGVQSGSGAQKSAIVIAQIESQYNAFATELGIPVIPANVQSYVNAVVAALNSFPSVATPTSTTSTSGSTPVISAPTVQAQVASSTLL